MKKQYVTYTSTMESKLMEEITEYATQKKLSKNKVIEQAIKNFLEKSEKEELVQSLQQIADDPDLVEMAEWGISDYAKQLDDYDNEPTGYMVRKSGTSRRK